MAAFIRLTTLKPDRSRSLDVVINAIHIGTVTAVQNWQTKEECSHVALRGGIFQNKPLYVAGTVAQIGEALACDCRVAILSLNDEAPESHP